MFSLRAHSMKVSSVPVMTENVMNYDCGIAAERSRGHYEDCLFTWQCQAGGKKGDLEQEEEQDAGSCSNRICIYVWNVHGAVTMIECRLHYTDAWPNWYIHTLKYEYVTI